MKLLSLLLRRATQPQRPRCQHLRLEALECRIVPSTVTNLNDAGPGSLRQAILDTPSGGTVDFQPGLTGTIVLTTGELAITHDLTIAGPGVSILTVSGNHASRVFDIAANSTVTISGLTVANGQAPSGHGGGGITNAGTLVLTDSTLNGNSTDNGNVGGGIENAGTLTVTRSSVRGNDAAGSGGINNDGMLTVTGSTISGNTAIISAGGIGNTGTMTMTDSTVSGNGSDKSSGGGVWNSYFGTVTVIRSIISGNSSFGGNGGGIISYGGTVNVIDSTISDNSSEGAGGGIDNGGTLNLTGSTLSGNSADSGGGGIANFAMLVVTDSTLSGNGAGVGAGIDNYSGSLTVIGSTLSGNHTSGSGGGVYQGSGQITLRDTLLAGNTAAPFYATPDISAMIQSQGHNLIGDGTGGSGYSATDLIGTAADPIDPRLGPLADNGGPTQTMALLPHSPALDVGDPTQLGVPDQRGVVRSGGINIGAYQASATAFVLMAPAKVTAGVPFDLTVTAVDPFGQLAAGYTGTVTFSTSDPDPGVVLPADYAFTAADAGVHTFSDTGLGETTLRTRGYQSLTVTDTADGSITGSTVVKVRHLRHHDGGNPSLPAGLEVVATDRFFALVDEGYFEFVLTSSASIIR